MNKPPGRFRLYDLILECDIDLSLSRAGEEQGGQERWRFREGPVAEATGICVHDVLDFDQKRRLKVWVEDEDRLIFSHGEMRVLWDRAQKEILFEAGADLEFRRAIVLERVVAPIAYLLQRPSFVAFHASAVGDGRGGAWIFVGNSGAGKSTTALGLMRQGMDLLADDLVLVESKSGLLYAATPTLRLFDRPEDVPEAVDAEMVMPEIEKYWYQLPDRISDVEEHRLQGIFSLEPQSPGPGREGSSAEITALRGRGASMPVLAQAFDLTEGPRPWRTQRFRALCELARGIPVYRVEYQKSSARTPAQVIALAEFLTGQMESDHD